jgi:hypothetical protein
MKELKTEVRGSSLYLSFEGPWSIGRSAKVYVVMDDIEEISSGGGSDVRTHGIVRTRRLMLRSSGGSDMDLDVAVSELDIECSGGSDVSIRGTADHLRARTSGGSDLKGFDLVADEADLQSSGGSDMQVHVVKKLHAKASGGSDIQYMGNPQNKQIESSSNADIEKVGN